ncbi:MAG: hypothetical protein Gaeavirus7_20 [Gaeavirus sp.]|uniref:Uncharacterized protein n=1 Tax=Gaeavirus sp. TaxID=2487767 RepID=A0A3G5A2K4_9VIRU|nr:MAG: hypothetical protein Gaeavirus7_20 [Gaeavirus sp.]
MTNILKAITSTIKTPIKISRIFNYAIESFRFSYWDLDHNTYPYRYATQNNSSSEECTWGSPPCLIPWIKPNTSHQFRPIYKTILKHPTIQMSKKKPSPPIIDYE